MINVNELRKIANQMVAPGKGILAIDETAGTMDKRLLAVGYPENEVGVANKRGWENRRRYREVLIDLPSEASTMVSGMILNVETTTQATSDGRPFLEVLKDNNILPGVKVDSGQEELPAVRENVTIGLDNLFSRLNRYHEAGIKFAKWRATYQIGHNTPSEAALEANGHSLARYAAACQHANIVPIVEPEVLINGNHDIVECFCATSTVLRVLFKHLVQQQVYVDAMVLKPSMVIDGKDTTKPVASASEVADKTLFCLSLNVPAAVPGVAFLSGGQSPDDAMNHLNLMNVMRNSSHPWALTFSYGRALQNEALDAWAAIEPWKASGEGGPDAAREALLKRIRQASAASLGQLE